MLRDEPQAAPAENSQALVWQDLVHVPLLWSAVLFALTRAIDEHVAHFDEPWSLRWLRLALGHPVRTWLALVLLTWALSPPRRAQDASAHLGSRRDAA